MKRSDIIRGLTEIRDPEFLFAQRYLADAHIDLSTQVKEAREYLNAGSVAGSPEAQLALSKLIIVDLLDCSDAEDALRWCRRAADLGYPPALVYLASFYSEGWAGLQRDDDRALELLHKGAELGYSHAMSLLAIAYSEGIRAKKDTEIGRKFLIQAAEHGDGNSQYLLGVALLSEADVPSSTEGIRWIRAAADQNLSSAHRLLANLYQVGRPGIPRDEYQAGVHRRRADELDQGI